MSETARARRFTVPDGWSLPDLTGLAEGLRIVREPARVRAAYYDTAALDLTAAGVRVGRIGSNGATGHTGDVVWHLSVPGCDDAGELRLEAPARGVPAELRTVTAGLRTGPLRQVASLDVRREWHVVLGPDDVEQLRIGVDLVTGHRPDADTASRRWRSVHVTPAPGGDPKLHRKAARALDRSGAHQDDGDELARVVDDAAPCAPGGDTLDQLVRRYLEAQYAVLMRADMALRGAPAVFGEADLVHQTRIAVRRYRSVLRTLTPLFDTERAAALDTELRWWAHTLGAVRDQHVLRTAVLDRLDALPVELVLGPVAVTVHRELDVADERAESALVRARRSTRYAGLLAELSAWRAAPPFVASEGGQPAAKVQRYLDAAEQTAQLKLRRARSAGKNREDRQHRARRAAKRLRYLAELAEPALGKSARRTGAAAKRTQESLGDAQDAMLAAQFLRGLGARFATAAGDNGFTYGLLAAGELARADRGQEN